MDIISSTLSDPYVRGTLLLTTGAMAAYTLQPLPKVFEEKFIGNHFLQFASLLLFLLLVYPPPITMSSFMIALFCALTVILLFEYWRQMKKKKEKRFFDKHKN